MCSRCNVWMRVFSVWSRACGAVYVCTCLCMRECVFALVTWQYGYSHVCVNESEGEKDGLCVRGTM